jgi:apolipoprotein N-acyltransferase
MRWNLGLGGWGIGRDSTLFAFRDASGDSVKFASFICYESIYPGYVAGYVRRGAQFLTVITNDSWWGNTSGAYQHKQFATLRAIENRRWLVRCANGGISCAIDPSGRTVAETEMYTRSVLRVSVTPSRELTFFSIHGDWIAELSLIMSLCILVASGGSRFYKRFRAQQDIQTGKEDPQ